MPETSEKANLEKFKYKKTFALYRINAVLIFDVIECISFIRSIRGYQGTQ